MKDYYFMNLPMLESFISNFKVVIVANVWFLSEGDISDLFLSIYIYNIKVFRITTSSCHYLMVIMLHYSSDLPGGWYFVLLSQGFVTLQHWLEVQLTTFSEQVVRGTVVLLELRPRCAGVWIGNYHKLTRKYQSPWSYHIIAGLLDLRCPLDIAAKKTTLPPLLE